MTGKSKTSGLVLLLLSSLGIQGCGGIETVIVGSALGLAGDKGIEYFKSGSVRKIVYKEQEKTETHIINAFHNLRYLLIKRQEFQDKSVKIIGTTENDTEVKIEVKVKSLVDGVTELTVSARDARFLPEPSVCLLLMREIVAAESQRLNLDI